MRRRFIKLLKYSMLGVLGVSAVGPGGPGGPGGPDGPDPFGPAAPATTKGLKDYDAIKEKEAVGILYKLGILKPVYEEGEFWLNPDEPLPHEGVLEILRSAKLLAADAPPPPPGDPLSVNILAPMVYGQLKDGGLTVITESYRTDCVTFPENSAVVAPEGKQVVMTIDGVQTRMAPGTYKGDIAITVSDAYIISNMGSNYYAKTAVMINGGLVEGKSVLSAVKSGTVEDTSADDVVIDSRDDNFNGFIIDGDSKYVINRPKITLNGHGGDDFAGYGAGIMTTGKADVVVDGAYIETTGAIRTAIWGGGESTLLVKNSEVVGYDGKDLDFDAAMMKEVPWILGLSGNLRATNALGASNVTYLNSTVTTEAWGALSTDGTMPGSSLTTINTKGIISGESGYGGYADGDIRNFYYGSYFKIPDIGLIVAAGDCGAVFGKASAENVGYELYSEIPDDRKDAPCVIESGRMGVMWHKNQDGVVEVKEGTVFDCGETVFVVKSDCNDTAYPVLKVDGSVLKSKSGMILHLMEGDDPGMGSGGPGSPDMWASCYLVPEVEPVKDGTDVSALNETTFRASFSNMEITGDFYNTRWTAGQNMSVDFDNVKVNGAISAGVQAHVNVAPGEKITKENYYEISNVKATPAPVVSNGVIVSLKGGSVWNVTGTSYISSLTVGEGCSVNGKMTVNGNDTAPVPSEYKGEITIMPAV